MKAVPISKPKQQSLKATAAEIKRRIEVVDRAGELAPLVKEFETLKKEIRGWADAEYPASEAVIFEGRSHAVAVSAKGNKRRIKSMDLLFKFLGVTKFLAWCGFTIENAEKQLTAEQFAQVVEEEKYVSERTVKPMPKASAPAVMKPAA